jgi:hypothetical protein
MECECDLKLRVGRVYFSGFQVMSRYAPIEILEALALLKLGVKCERGQAQ